MSADEHLILCLRCQAYRPITKFRIKFPLDPLKDPALIYRPRATCKVCTAQKKHVIEVRDLALHPKVPPPGVTTKRCKECGEEKLFSEFYRLRSGVWGLDPRCKRCKSTGEAARQRRKWRETREVMAERRYGLTPERYEALYERQGKACGICGTPSTKHRLHIDHNHTTGVVRGLLCVRCNTFIGQAREKIIFLERAAAYLYAETHDLDPLDVTATVYYELQRHSW